MAGGVNTLEVEDDIDSSLRDIDQIEREALAQPASDVAAIRFKLSLWANGRVDGFEQEWRIFAADCERFLSK